MGNAEIPDRVSGPPPRRLVDYYRFLAVPRTAPPEMIVEAYLLKVEEGAGDARTAERAERALAVLSDPATRAAYDQELAAGQAPPAGAPGRPPPRPAARPAAPSRAPDAVMVRPARAAGAPPAGMPPRPGPRRPAQVAAPAPPVVINITWRWALALIPLVVIILGVLALQHGADPGGGGDSSNGTFNQAIIGRLTAQAVSAPLGPDGVQTLAVVVNGTTMSYRPDVIKVKVGVPVRFNLTAEGRDPG